MQKTVAALDAVALWVAAHPRASLAAYVVSLIVAVWVF